MHKEQQKTDERFILKPYTKKELRALYGVPERTFYNWLKPYHKELGLGKKQYLTINQVKFILEKFGVPGKTM